MEIAKIPENEAGRLQALKAYSILDTLPEKDFEDITKIASEMCQTKLFRQRSLQQNLFRCLIRDRSIA